MKICPRLAWLVVVPFLLAGCGPASDVRHDEGLEAALVEVRGGEEPVRLADLTPFEWDTVYIFEPYVNGEFVNDVVGRRVLPEDYGHDVESRDLVIFLSDGELVHAATVQRMGIGPGSDQRYVVASGEAWVIPVDPWDRRPSLRLAEELPDD